MVSPLSFSAPSSLLTPPLPVVSAQLEAALENVRAILGSEERSGFTDSFIRETLYDCYFDVEKSVEWLSGMSCTRPLGERLTLPKRSKRGRTLHAREKVSHSSLF